MKAQQVTQLMHSRWVLILIALCIIPAAHLTLLNIPIEYVEGDRGLIFPSANLWIQNHTVAFWVNIIGTYALAALMITLNRGFNLLRAMTLLDSSLFLLMSLSTPWLLVQFYTGTPLCLTLLLCLFLLYSTYSEPHRRKRIFLIFFILSAMTMTQYCYAVFIPVFIIGTVQMRVFSPKTVMAIILGLITPWWIVLGSGIAGVEDIHGPRIHEMLDEFDIVENFELVVAVVFSGLLLVVGWFLNFPKMIAYNAHMRAYNGTLSVLALFTLLAVCIDFTNLAAYAPLLFMCAAFYIGRMFAANESARSYIAIMGIFATYILLFAWTLIYNSAAAA